MARQINGHLGNFTSVIDLTVKFPPSEYSGCSANLVSGNTSIKYWSNGLNWNPVDAQAINSIVSGISFTDLTYDGTGKLISYTRGGIAHTVDYPNSTTITISNTTGASRSITLDISGKITSIT